MRPARYNFVVELKDLIAVPDIAERLRRPAKSDKVSLGYQLDELVRTGFLKDYVAEPATTATLPPPAEEQAHETPVLG